MSLDYHDMVGQIYPKLTVDEYAAKMGKDSDIVTLTFLVKSKQVGEDLVDWLERGYDFVLYAQVSKGEISPGKYVVFVEMERRLRAPERIIELITDMETLTDVPCKDWTINIEGEDYDADIEQLKKILILK